MSGERWLVTVSGIVAISALATCIWFAAPLKSARSEESDPAATGDEKTLEIPTFGTANPSQEEGLGDVSTYEYERSVNEAFVAPAGEYLKDGSDFDPGTRATQLIGITVTDELSKVEGRWVESVMIVKVLPSSLAAKVGLRGRQTMVQHLLDGVAIAGSIFFPPAFIVVPLVEEAEIGKTYDLIVGVDGERIRDLMDLDDALRKAEPGEIVYVSIIRAGHRLQIPVPLPRERVQY